MPDSSVKPFKVVAAALMLALGVGFLSFALQSSNAAQRDYITYWAAGQQLIHHQNPYDGASILRIEKAAGFTDSRPFFMRNPPGAFFMTLPLGLVSMRTGAILWSLAIIAALMISLRLIWSIHGRPPDRLHLVGYLFPPALACLLEGQTGIFLLLGIALFLRFRESRPYLAGAALVVPALKPQLFLPFGIVLLAWIVTRRAYRVLAGAAIAILLSDFVALILDPAGWTQYARMIHSQQIGSEFIPTTSLIFRLAVGRNALWLQFLPATLACVWATIYFLKRREDWDWESHGSLLLLVSIMVAPYAWFTDEAIVLPAILAGIYLAANTGRSLLPYGFVAGIALIEVFAHLATNSGAYVWTAPAWLAWYLFTTRRQPATMRGTPPPTVPATSST